MPAPKMMNSKDIAAYMGCSIREAQCILKTLEQNGQTSLVGKKKRVVNIKVFARFLSLQDGMDERERIKDISETMREVRCNA